MTASTITSPGDRSVITTIEAHTGGEPLRVITGGLPEIPGDSILAKRRYARSRLDHLRKGLMWEPRGHADMYGAIITEPVTPDGDLGVLFLHNEGFSTMCGHGVIALTKVVLDTGLIDKDGEHPVLEMDTPAGRVTAKAFRKNGTVERVSFRNVPSFVFCSDRVVEVPGIGEVRVDVAFGGAFYAYCDAADLGIGLKPEDHDRLVEVGRKVKQAVMETINIEHPFEADLGFLYGTIIVGDALDPAHHSRNVCIFAEGEVDRSPTGTGVSGRTALLYSRSELGIDQSITIESILGTTMTVRVLETTEFGPFEAVIPEVSGTAFIVGEHRFYFDSQDPLNEGFIFR